MPRTTELRRAYHINYIAQPDNRAKIRCRQQCIVAIRSGRLVRQLCACGSTAKTDAHHEDYSKPLDVIWLCRPCHLARHRGERRPHAGASAQLTHCQRGHAFEGHNIMILKTGKRKCRRCDNDNSNRRRSQSRIREQAT